MMSESGKVKSSIVRTRNSQVFVKRALYALALFSMHST